MSIFLFTHLSLMEELDAALMERSWGEVTCNNTIISFKDTGTIMGHNKVVPVMIWDMVPKKLEVWVVVCKVFLGNYLFPLETFDMELIINKTEGIGVRLQVHTQQQS